MDEARNFELVFLEAIGRSAIVTGVTEHTAARTHKPLTAWQHARTPSQVDRGGILGLSSFSSSLWHSLPGYDRGGPAAEQFELFRRTRIVNGEFSIRDLSDGWRRHGPAGKATDLFCLRLDRYAGPKLRKKFYHEVLPERRGEGNGR
jgi:hypothetical protein